eukprot:2248466-Prymnesium_polylepis.2
MIAIVPHDVPVHSATTPETTKTTVGSSDGDTCRRTIDTGSPVARMTGAPERARVREFISLPGAHALQSREIRRTQFARGHTSCSRAPAGRLSRVCGAI